MTEPDWDLYRTFLAVAEFGSLSRAARTLRLAQPTVGRRLEALEAALGGVTLFTRSPTGLRPTEAALSLLEHARTMGLAADAMVRAASGVAGSEAGAVRITASEVVGAEVLPDILTAIRRRWPGIVIELVLSNRAQDLLRREADIAVRMVRPEQDALVARKVGPVALGLFARRDYVALYGEPRTLGDPGHTAVGFDRDYQVVRAASALGVDLTRDFFGFRSDSDLAQLAAVRAGFGIGACMFGIARRSPDLVQVLPDRGFELEMWVVMHEDLKSSRRVRLVFDALVAGLTEYAAGSQAPEVRTPGSGAPD